MMSNTSRGAYACGRGRGRGRAVDREEEGGGGGLDDGFYGVEEGDHGNPLVALGERVGGVDIAVACDAEGGRVCPACDTGRRLLTDLAHPHTLVSGVQTRVARQANEHVVRAAEHQRGGQVAVLARFPHPGRPAAVPSSRKTIGDFSQYAHIFVLLLPPFSLA